MNSLGWLESVWQDLRYGARNLRANPAFTFVALLSLALGIGANAALFQLIDAVMLRSLPVKAPEQLVRIKVPDHSNRNGNFWDQPNDITEPQWEFLRAHHAPFQDVFAWARTRFNLAESGPVHFVHGIYVSGDFFHGLGVPAVIGRTITVADDHKGCGPSAVLSYSFWQQHFGGSPSVLGKTVSLDGRKIPVIGVTTPEFTGLNPGEQFAVAVPICSIESTQPKDTDWRRVWWLGAFGRLKPGASLREANAFLQSISPELYRSTVSPHYQPDTVKDYLKLRLEAIPGGTGFSTLRRSVETPLLLLFSLAGLVLVIACANLANLLLARATTREHEIAVRLAVGASRWRVMQQLLSESLLLAALGSAAGAALAISLSRYLVSAFSTADNVYSLNLNFNSHFLGFLIGTALLTCVLFGLMPALQASRLRPGSALKQAGRNTTPGRERFALQRTLVVAQVSLSLILVVGSLVFVRSFQKLMTLDPGFRTDGILEAGIDFRAPLVPDKQRLAIDDDILKQLQAVPGIDSAAAVLQPAIAGGYSNDRIHIDGDKTETRMADFNWIGENYFHTMNIPLLAGRDFTPHDDNTSAPAAIVDTTFASKFLNGANPIGKTFYVLPDPGQAIKRFTVVGLVGRSKYSDLQTEFQPMVYQPIRQQNEQFGGIWFVVHSNLPLASTIKQVSGAVKAADPQLPVYLRSLPSLINDSVRNEDVMAQLSSCFGLLALILATIGLYGVMSFIVTHRQNEIGIRLAIGASRKAILAMILKQAVSVLVIGLLAGVALSLLLSRWAQSLLFDVKANDPYLIAAATLLLAAITLAATLIPAKKAANLDPMQILRNE
jgi:predicted permease